MFNFKASGIAAGAAFFLSFLIGLVSGTSMPQLFVRAVIFGVVFFVLAGAIRFLVGRFLPELLPRRRAEDSAEFAPGSRLDITDEDPGTAQGTASSSQVFMGAQADDSHEGLGHIDDLLKKDSLSPQVPEAGMDQNMQDGYNESSGTEESPQPDAFVPWEPLLGASNSAPAAEENPAGSVGAAAPVTNSDSADFFPDLDSMAGAFMPASAKGEQDTVEYSGSFSSKQSRSNKAPAWSGDYSAKDMASGLKTVLNKGKEG